MTDNQRRLCAIEVAIELVRADYRDVPYFELPETVTAEEVLLEVVHFACAQTPLAALALRSTPEAEFADYLSRAADLLGSPAPVVPLHPEDA